MNPKGTKATPASEGSKVLVQNKKARFNYNVVETFEAGIVLTGAEIKSVRLGGVSLNEAYIVPDKNELFLINAHIKPYQFDTDPKYNPTRRRKLLMHRQEIDKLRGRVEAKGFTLVPTKLYLKRGLAKIEVALAKGKAAPDKRTTIKDREGKREAERAMKESKR
ncbi:MAG: SsrA-binding protein SmpB [Bdellovibrionales bacterium]|nr:SsrA-binding protein SmpB [Bdellovibrionales bacterium]